MGADKEPPPLEVAQEAGILQSGGDGLLMWQLPLRMPVLSPEQQYMEAPYARTSLLIRVWDAWLLLPEANSRVDAEPASSLQAEQTPRRAFAKRTPAAQEKLREQKLGSERLCRCPRGCLHPADPNTDYCDFCFYESQDPRAHVCGCACGGCNSPWSGHPDAKRRRLALHTLERLFFNNREQR